MKNLRIKESSPFPAFNPEYKEYKVYRDHTPDELANMHVIQQEEEIARGKLLATFPNEIQARDYLEQMKPYSDDMPLFSWNDIQQFIFQHNVNVATATELGRLKIRLMNQIL